jgi:tRNA 5-methylaminomethyl-2-thiouridine biosynthesis bifunctional protein
MYDSIVIGAGIAGCMVAYMLKKRGQEVLLVDRSAVAASGGSGAAGAFVSPKIGKGSALQTLTNEAYEYAKDFYIKHFPEHFFQTGVIRIPKDVEDSEKFRLYEPFNDTKYTWVNKEELETLGIHNAQESFMFAEAGVCDAPAMCRAIWKQVSFMQCDVEKLEFDGTQWKLLTAHCSLLTKNVVLSTGHQNNLLDMRYMGVRGTWGSRGDYYSKLKLDVSMHKSISVSANIDGIIKLGATHNKAKNPCMACDGKPLKSLEEQASQMVDTSDFILKETFCGMRAGSKDYFPLVGGVIDVPYMLEKYPNILRGAKPELKHINNIFICNGLGGRGFVFAPYMAKLLVKSIVEKKEIDKRVNPDRLFLKWCRKLNSNL